MKDFTISIYRELLNNLMQLDYNFKVLKEYLSEPEDKSIMLRHDVDARKLHSLRFAKIQHELGITGTYYFRMVPQSYDEDVIKDIADMGHEIGYHYETMDKANGNVKKAYELFCKELEQLRKIVPIKTVCMHGSPLSKYDNRDLWKHYDYRELGIIGEPYFDLDFNEVFYLTDTGRRWDGGLVSVRDTTWTPDPGEYKVPVRTKDVNDDFANKEYHSTRDIISSVKAGIFPNQVMMNFHPQRWTNNKLLWSQELVMQNIKNVIKRFLKLVN